MPVQNDKIYPVILCGGGGTRLWPLSTLERPKPFIKLVGDTTMLSQTLDRVADPLLFAAATIVSNAAYAGYLADCGADLTHRLLLEPAGRNTAPAIATAALALHEADPGAMLLILASDHVILNRAAFLDDVRRAQALAAGGAIVTFGIAPTEPHTGYGYIRRGAALGTPAAYKIERFIEKPDRATAETLVDSGDCYWNSGLFMARADTLLAAFQRHAPDLLAQAMQALHFARRTPAGRILDESAYAALPKVPFDVAVMEQTDRGVVLGARFDWSDVGDWNALHEINEKSDHGNVIQGAAVLADDVTNSYIHNTTQLPVYVNGLNDILIIVDENGIFIGPRTASQTCKRGAEEFAGRPARQN